MSEKQNKMSNVAQQFIAAIPHARALGMTIDSIGGGQAVMSMPYDERLIGDPDTRVIAGGAVFALIDTCAGAAVMGHDSSPKATATLDLRIDYMRGAKPGQRITAKATCYHVTSSVAFVRASAFDEDADLPVASAHGAFTLERGSKA